MGILKALSNAFTPRQFLKPSDWLRVIPLLQDALKGSLPLHVVTFHHFKNIFEALEAILLVEEQLKREVELSIYVEKEYPIKMTGTQFSLIEKLLYNSWLEGDS